MATIRKGQLVLVSVPDKRTEDAVVAYLAKIARGASEEIIRSRLARLPHTLFSAVSEEAGRKIAGSLQQLGAVADFRAEDEPVQKPHTEAPQAQPAQHAQAPAAPSGSIVLESIPDQQVEEKIISYISSLIKNLPPESIWARLQKLPRTMFTDMPEGKGKQIVFALQQLGAQARFEYSQGQAGALPGAPRKARGQGNTPAASKAACGDVVVKALPTQAAQEKLVAYLAGKADQQILARITARVKTFPIVLFKNMPAPEGIKIARAITAMGAVAGFTGVGAHQDMQDSAAAGFVRLEPAGRSKKQTLQPAIWVAAALLLTGVFFGTQYMIQVFFMPEDPYFNKKNAEKIEKEWAVYDEKLKEQFAKDLKRYEASKNSKRDRPAAPSAASPRKQNSRPQSEKVLQLTAANFKEVVERPGMLLVHFSSDSAGCRPCIASNAFIDQTAAACALLQFGRVIWQYKSTEAANKELLVSANIENLPTVILFKDGKEEWRITGNSPEEQQQLAERIRQYCQ